MSLQVEKLEKNMAKITVEVPAEQFEKALTAAFNKNKSRFNIPGFRKGKAPQAMVEKMYGVEVLYEDAILSLIHISTARGLGYALDLGIELLALLTDREHAGQIKDSIQYDQIPM